MNHIRQSSGGDERGEGPAIIAKIDDNVETGHKGASSTEWIPSNGSTGDNPSADLERGERIKQPGKHTERIVSHGVYEMEKIATCLNKRWTAMLFVEIFMVGYVLSMDVQTRYAFQTQALDYLNIHSSMAVVDTVQQTVSSCIFPLLAHIANDASRTTVLTMGIILYGVGGMFVAIADNLGIFVVGTTLMTVGGYIILFMMDTLCADLSLMNWRMFASMTPLMPIIINTWIGGFLVDSYMQHDNTRAIGKPEGWRIGLGQWGIIMASFGSILVGTLYHLKRAAKIHKTPHMHCPSDNKQIKGLGESNSGNNSSNNSSDKNVKKTPVKSVHKQGSLKSIADSLYRYDAVGMLLLCASALLILLPMSLASGNGAKWRSVKYLAPIAVGVSIFTPMFVLWELRSPWPVISRRIACNRGVWAPMICIFLSMVTWEMQLSFLYTLLQVGMNVSARASTVIINIFLFSLTLVSFLIGILVVKMRHMKPFVITGFTLWYVSFGMMHVYRVRLNSLKGIVASEVVRGIGNGFATHVTKTLMQAEVQHENATLMIAAYRLVFYGGLATGGAILSVIWGSVLPYSLHEYMDDSTDAESAFARPLTFIGQKAPWGSQKRQQMIRAYGDTEKVISNFALCSMAVIYVLGFFYRNRRLARRIEQDDADLVDDIDYSGTPRPKRWVLQMKDMIFETFKFG